MSNMLVSVVLVQADIMELVQPAVSSGAKLELHSRMTRTYAVLKP